MFCVVFGVCFMLQWKIYIHQQMCKYSGLIYISYLLIYWFGVCSKRLFKTLVLAVLSPKSHIHKSVRDEYTIVVLKVGSGSLVLLMGDSRHQVKEQRCKNQVIRFSHLYSKYRLACCTKVIAFIQWGWNWYILESTANFGRLLLMIGLFATSAWWLDMQQSLHHQPPPILHLSYLKIK